MCQKRFIFKKKKKKKKEKKMLTTNGVRAPLTFDAGSTFVSDVVAFDV